jgi:MOSC domain-containing protein YiiM
VEYIKDRPHAGTVKAVSVSTEKGKKKVNTAGVTLREGFGIIGDAHAGTKNRQVSILAAESIEKMRAKGLSVRPGDFAENITTECVDLSILRIGDRLKIGGDVLLEISQIGKECHSRCEIYYQAGECVMPKEGIFGRVLNGGFVKPGDKVEIIT